MPVHGSPGAGGERLQPRALHSRRHRGDVCRQERCRGAEHRQRQRHRCSATSPTVAPRSPSSTSLGPDAAGRSCSASPTPTSRSRSRGTAESFLAGESNQGQNFPINQYNLTPNMVSGLHHLALPGARRLATPSRRSRSTPCRTTWSPPWPRPAVTCARTGGLSRRPRGRPSSSSSCRSTTPSTCSTRCRPATSPRSTFGSFNSNVSSGSSYQATSWLCTAPNTPFTGAGRRERAVPAPVNVTVTDHQRGADDPHHPAARVVDLAAVSGCHLGLPRTARATRPSRPCRPRPTTTAPAQSPAFQAKAMRTWCYGGGVLPQPQNPQDPVRRVRPDGHVRGRASYGLSTASLENAAGNFVAPTIDQPRGGRRHALTACPTGDLSCPAGTYSINYADTEPGRLSDARTSPTPSCRRRRCPTTRRRRSSHLLTNLVTYSHTGRRSRPGTPRCPTPSTPAALADIAKDISSGRPRSRRPPRPRRHTSAGVDHHGRARAQTDNSGTLRSSGIVGVRHSGGQSSRTPAHGIGQLRQLGSRATRASTPVAAPPASIPTGFLLVGLSATTRFLLPAIVAAGPRLARSVACCCSSVPGPRPDAARRRTGGAS